MSRWRDCTRSAGHRCTRKHLLSPVDSHTRDVPGRPGPARPFAEEDSPHCSRMLQGGPLATGVLGPAVGLLRKAAFLSSLDTRVLSVLLTCPPATTCLPLGQGQRCAYLSPQPRRCVQPGQEALWMVRGGRSGAPCAGAVTPNPTNTVRCGFTLTLPPCLWPLQWAPGPSHTGVFPGELRTSRRPERGMQPSLFPSVAPLG